MSTSPLSLEGALSFPRDSRLFAAETVPEDRSETPAHPPTTDLPRHAAGRQLTSISAGPLQIFRIQQLQVGLQSIELAARRTTIAGDVIRTSQVLVRRAVVDLRVSSFVLERYAHRVSALQSQDPKLLQDFLALVELLDQKTFEELDSFFERLRLILEGNPSGVVRQAPEAAIDINVPMRPEAETTEQVSAFFLHVRVTLTSIEVTTTTTTVAQSDPLVLDLDGDGIEVTSLEGGRHFDIDADGLDELTAFVTGGDAFLALDRNGNGRIDDGSELFGDQHGAEDGFAELLRFDDNGDRVIDDSDRVYGSLVLYDGASLWRLAEAGVIAIGASMGTALQLEVNGNRVAGDSFFLRADGTSGKVADVLLNYLA